MKDKDIFETQKLRKEVLPPMWDVYEKTVSNKENDGELLVKSHFSFFNALLI